MKKLSQFVVLGLLSLTVAAENAWVSPRPSYRQITVTGFSRARNSMVLSTEVAEKVEQVFVDVGDVIPEHGKTLCLDDTFINLEINTVKKEIEQVGNDIRFFKKQLDRYQVLVGKNSAAISQLDEFQRQFDNSQSLQQIKKIQKQNLLEKRKRHCILAPAGWYITERYVEAGQWLNFGNRVAKIGNYSKMLVPLALSVVELQALQEKSQEFTVWLSEYELFVPASIERISPAFDDKTRKVQVDLLIHKNLPVLRGGLRVEVTLDIPDPIGTWQISEKALDKRFEQVWVERKDGQTFRVRLLGSAKKGLVRIASEQIKGGDLFKIFKP